MNSPPVDFLSRLDQRSRLLGVLGACHKTPGGFSFWYEKKGKDGKIIKKDLFFSLSYFLEGSKLLFVEKAILLELDRLDEQATKEPTT